MNSEEQDTPPSGKSNVVRIVFMCSLLVVVIAGAIWEFGMTIPGFQKAKDDLQALSKANMIEAKTRADVIEQIAGKPAETEYKKIELEVGDGEKTIRHQRVDRYRWRRIIPGKKKLEIFVTYELKPTGDQGGSVDPENCGDAEWAFKSFYEPGNAPANITVQARKPPPPEVSIFRTLDDDVDQFISGEEIIQGSTIEKRMELFDPDGDKKVSLDEFKAGIAKMEEDKGDKLNQDELYGFFGGRSPGQGGDSGPNDKKGPGKKGAGKKGPGGKGFGGKGNGPVGEKSKKG